MITQSIGQLEDGEYANLIIYGGDILTVDPNFSIENGIAIQGNIILGTGSFDQLINQFGKNGYTNLLDLDSKAIFPGLIDGHSHMFDLSRFNEYGISGSQDLALSYGYTTINEKYGKEDIIELLILAEKQNELKMRINMFASYSEASLDENNKSIILSSWFPANEPITSPNSMFRIPGIKIFIDGSFQPGRGAWAMSEPFPEEDMTTWLKSVTDNPYGNLYFNQSNLQEIVQHAQNMGYQVAFHAMGDRAIETVVNTIGNVTGSSNTDYRHQIEHSSYLRNDLMERYIETDIISSVRGYWPACDQTTENVDNFFFGDYFNKEWYANRYTMISNEIRVYLETDFGWTHDIGDRTAGRNLDPFLNLFSLVTRSAIGENETICTGEDWSHPNKISFEQALRTMTINAAYAVFQENVIGSLESGKFADLVILPESPDEISPNELKDLYALATMVNGEFEYIHDGFNLGLQLLTSVSSSDNLSNLQPFWLLVIILVTHSKMTQRIKQLR
jgi:predicted amidohydrolase YtcJ